VATLRQPDTSENAANAATRAGMPWKTKRITVFGADSGLASRLLYLPFVT
jgi:hypothetical protein